MKYERMTDHELSVEVEERRNWENTYFPEYATDLNAAITLFTLTGRECSVGPANAQVDENEYVFRWHAWIDHEGAELPLIGWADEPARAVCLAWLRWHDTQPRDRG